MADIKEKAIDTVTELGGSAAGAAVGAAVGTAVAGPLGAVGGALAGTILEKGFQLVGNEIKNRMLSPKEEQRVGAVYTYANQKISRNLVAGRMIRTDSFFEGIGEERPTNEEILEGVLLAAQKEYEEKKLKYLGNLYANLPFNETVDSRMANMLIKIASELTYRQYVILYVVNMFQNPAYDAVVKKEPYESLSGFKTMTIATEVFDLYRRTLIHSSEALLDAAAINPSKLTLVGYGSLMFELMELNEIMGDPICSEIVLFMAGMGQENGGQEMKPGTFDGGTNWIEFGNRIDDLQEEVKSIPRLQITTEENEGGGQTLIFDGGNAGGSKEFIETEFVVNQLKQI